MPDTLSGQTIIGQTEESGLIATANRELGPLAKDLAHGLRSLQQLGFFPNVTLQDTDATARVLLGIMSSIAVRIHQVDN